MSKDKALEFWIDHECIGDSCQSTCHVYSTKDASDIHVIDYAAYAALEAKLAVAVECLTYIGNGQTRMYLAQEFARACLAKLKGGTDET